MTISFLASLPILPPERLSSAARGAGKLESLQSGHQAGPGADTREIRHFLHLHDVQPGGRTGARLHRRHRAAQSWRHRDGTGAHTKVAQVVAAEFGAASVTGAGIRDGHLEGTEHLGERGFGELRPQRQGGAGRQPHDSRAAAAVRLRALWRAGDAGAVQAGQVLIGQQRLGFEELVRQAYRARVSLSATGFYRTPKIDWDKASMRGQPFFYFAYGAAVSEVAVDTLTGETQLLRIDILHDVGHSLNPAIDIGQIEGGFLQGAGWLTSEELWWNERGELKTHAPSTYKIPTARDWPAQSTIRLLQGEPNREDTIYRSKAVGEPPLMLAISVLHAIRDAVASCGPATGLPELRAPATPEAVLQAIQSLRARSEL